MKTIRDFKGELKSIKLTSAFYYCETTNERIKILNVFTNGLVNVINKKSFKYQIHIGEIKKVY